MDLIVQLGPCFNSFRDVSTNVFIPKLYVHGVQIAFSSRVTGTWPPRVGVGNLHGVTGDNCLCTPIPWWNQNVRRCLSSGRFDHCRSQRGTQMNPTTSGRPCHWIDLQAWFSRILSFRTVAILVVQQPMQVVGPHTNGTKHFVHRFGFERFRASVV